MLLLTCFVLVCSYQSLVPDSRQLTVPTELHGVTSTKSCAVYIIVNLLQSGQRCDVT